MCQLDTVEGKRADGCVATRADVDTALHHRLRASTPLGSGDGGVDLDVVGVPVAEGGAFGDGVAVACGGRCD